MNVGRKLVKDLKKSIKDNMVVKDMAQAGMVSTLDLLPFIEKLEEWIEFHEEMFDHSKFKKGVSKKKIKEWKEYYEDISNR